MAGTGIIHCKKCGSPLVAGTVVCPYCNQKSGARKTRQKKDRGNGLSLNLQIPIPVVTLIILLLNTGFGIYKNLGNSENILLSYGMVQGALQNGSWQRMLFSNFLHFGLWHFAANMYAVVIYGFLFENQIGRAKYALIYLASMAGAVLLINFAGGSHTIHCGASGAIFGLMTADLVYCLKEHRKLLHLLYALHAVIGNVLYTLFTSGISWQGHIGGAIAGVIIGLILFSGNGEKRETSYGR